MLAIAIAVIYLAGIMAAWLFCQMSYTAAHDFDETPTE